MTAERIPSGSTLGILGDGQLGRLTILGGASLGFSFATLGHGGRESPAGQVARAAYAWGSGNGVNEKALEQFLMHAPRAVLIEWENVPLELLRAIEARGIPVRPNSHVLALAQDRFEEKGFARSLGIAIPRFRTISRKEDAARYDYPTILKTRRDGYDGKGQVRLEPGDDVVRAWEELGSVPCILEEMIEIDREISVIVFRQPDCHPCFLGPFENAHEDGILRTSTYPAKITEAIADQAILSSITLAEGLGVHGILATEYLLSKKGELLFNEMAPRPHNSGHLTDGCADTSQFEQYVRAVCGWPWGSTKCLPGRMENLLGDEVLAWETRSRGTGSVRLYGKHVIMPRRKMGHITWRR